MGLVSESAPTISLLQSDLFCESTTKPARPNRTEIDARKIAFKPTRDQCPAKSSYNYAQAADQEGRGGDHRPNRTGPVQRSGDCNDSRCIGRHDRQARSN